MRIIVFSGKGGSGVTTLAAATAAAISAGGRQTLAFALVPGLHQAFGIPPSCEPQKLTPYLTSIEAHQGLAEGDEFRRWLTNLLDWRGIEAGLAEDIAALPGLGYTGRLLELERQASSGRFDVIVVDGGPLPHFLDLPGALDAAARWLERLFAPRQQTMLEPFFRVFAAEYASTGDDVFDRGRELLGRLAQLREIITDPEVCSLRLVARPERHAAAGLRSTIATLALYSTPVDVIAMNQLLPASLSDPSFQARVRRQGETRAEIEASLAPLPVLSVPLASVEPAGIGPLEELAEALYSGRDPAGVLHQSRKSSFERRDGRYILTLPLPFTNREELRLEQLEDAVAIHLNGRRCVVQLPDEARYHEATSWSLEDQVLRVGFEL